MSDEQRHSIAAQPSLITDPIEEARRESANALAQFDRVLDLIDEVTRDNRPFRFRTSVTSICTAWHWRVSAITRGTFDRLMSKSARANMFLPKRI